MGESLPLLVSLGRATGPALCNITAAEAVDREFRQLLGLGPGPMGPGPGRMGQGPGRGAENIDFPLVFKGLEPETLMFLRFFKIWAEVGIANIKS